MNKIFLIFILLFSTLVFSSPSYANWKVVAYTDNKNFYVDFDRIRKNGGYVYYWLLMDYLKPHKSGVLSVKSYTKADCNLFKYMTLQVSSFKGPMGDGTGSSIDIDSKWNYPPPKSSIEIILNSVCSR